MKKIVCNRIDNLPETRSLKEFFLSYQDVSYHFGLPLATTPDKCNFINSIPLAPTEFKKNTLPITIPYVWTQDSNWQTIHTHAFHTIALNILMKIRIELFLIIL